MGVISNESAWPNGAQGKSALSSRLQLLYKQWRRTGHSGRACPKKIVPIIEPINEEDGFVRIDRL
jgi:hypothetical protein